MKLFNIKPIQSETTIYLNTYKGNRVALKFIKLLKKGGVYKVKDPRRGDDEPSFTITITTDKTAEEDFNDFKNELISYIPDNFKSNYLFDFAGFCSLGYIKSMFIYCIGVPGALEVGHKIKEIRTSGESIEPKNQEQIKIN